MSVDVAFAFYCRTLAISNVAFSFQVLTLLHDILQYPRVPPVLPHGSSGSADRTPLVHSAAQPALPSRDQYSDDAFHALDRSSVRVSGGVPGVPPAERHSGGQANRVPSHEASSMAVKISDEHKNIARRHVKRHAQRTPKKHLKRSSKRHRASHHLSGRKVREYSILQESEGAESAAPALSAQLPRVEQPAISQLNKRAPDPSSEGAYTSVQDGAMPDRQPSGEPGHSGPLLQTVDKVAFPMDVKGPDFPKVEEDFNIQETGGLRKSTSIKDVLPSLIEIPHPGAVKVMAAGGNQQNADANAGLPNSAGNQASITELSEKQTAGVPEKYAGVSLTEDVQLDKNVHNQAAGAMSDSESVSGNYGQGHDGVSLAENVEFDNKDGISASNPEEVPKPNSEPQSMSVLESVTGDNGQGPGVSVQENVQLDQKRDAPQPGMNQPPSAVPQSSSPSAGSSNAGGSNGPTVSLTETAHFDRKDNGPPNTANQSPQTAPQSPSNSANGPTASHGPGVTVTEDVKVDHKDAVPSSGQSQAPGAGEGSGKGPGLSLTDAVQIGHNGNGQSNTPNQASQAMPGGQNSLGGQAITGGDGDGGAGRADGSVPDNGGHPEGQMNVEAYLNDQRGGGAPAPASPSNPAIRNEESVQANFDQTSQDQRQGAMPANPSQAAPDQSPGSYPQAPPEAAPSEGSSNQQQPSNPHQISSPEQPHDSADEGRIKISPKSEQVLEEQSNVKILLPYEGRSGGEHVPSGPHD